MMLDDAEKVDAEIGAGYKKWRVGDTWHFSAWTRLDDSNSVKGSEQAMDAMWGTLEAVLKEARLNMDDIKKASVGTYHKKPTGQDMPSGPYSDDSCKILLEVKIIASRY